MEKGLDKSEMQSREALSFMARSATPEKGTKTDNNDYLDPDQN